MRQQDRDAQSDRLRRQRRRDGTMHQAVEGRRTGAVLMAGHILHALTRRAVAMLHRHHHLAVTLRGKADGRQAEKAQRNHQDGNEKLFQHYSMIAGFGTRVSANP